MLCSQSANVSACPYAISATPWVGASASLKKKDRGLKYGLIVVVAETSDVESTKSLAAP